jgi:SAM-dependent methyltransferase
MLLHFFWDCLRRVCPGRIRRWIKCQRWFYPVSKAIFGNAVYSRSYFEDVERIESESVEHIAEWIFARFHPQRVLDVGCGPGHFMQALSRRGVKVFGVDISPQALRKVREKGLEGAQHDLTDSKVPLPGLPYDLVITCEVAEHLEPQQAPTFVSKLTEGTDIVYLTAAEPGLAGPGLYHVNEQPNEYWIALFAQRGFELDILATEDARRVFSKGIVVDYLARPLVFRRRDASPPHLACGNPCRDLQ